MRMRDGQADLGRRHLLEGDELEASLLESGDDLTDESVQVSLSVRAVEVSREEEWTHPRWTPSGLTMM